MNEEAKRKTIVAQFAPVNLGKTYSVDKCFKSVVDCFGVDNINDFENFLFTSTAKFGVEEFEDDDDKCTMTILYNVLYTNIIASNINNHVKRCLRLSALPETSLNVSESDFGFTQVNINTKDYETAQRLLNISWKKHFTHKEYGTPIYIDKINYISCLFFEVVSDKVGEFLVEKNDLHIKINVLG